MMHFACYAIENNGEFLPQLFKNRSQAIQICTQNGLPPECIVQLFRNIKLEYVEPAEEIEHVEP